MVDFINTNKAKGIIDQYLTNATYTSPPDINPIYDIREPGQEFPPLNPPIETTPDVPDDPCPMGYQLIDGVCQPINQFGGDMMNEVTGGGDDEVEERPYMSIEDMKGATDDDLLGYLTSGFLKNSALGYLPSKGTEVTLKMGKLPPLFQLAFGGQNELRKDFILGELMRRGYFTGKFDDQQNPIFDIGKKTKNPMMFNTLTGSTNEGIESMLPANTGGAVTDVYGDTYQQVYNSGTGDIGYTFTSGDPQPGVANVYDYPGSNQTFANNTQRVYGTGRGGTSDNQMTGGTVIVSGSPQSFDKDKNPEDDYDDESSGI